MTVAAVAPSLRAVGGTYLPIADHGVIGDLRSAALVGRDGTIDWFCPVRFDAPSVFASLRPPSWRPAACTSAVVSHRGTCGA
jgi:GH15 family glucan-1,4-alpha-glucosidase